MDQSHASRQKRRQWLLFYTAFLFILSVAIMFMPVANAVKEKSQVLLYFTGAFFWTGLLGVAITAIIINRARRLNMRFNKMYPGRTQVGAVHFFQNVPAIVADAIMFAAIVGFIIAMALEARQGYTFLFLAVFVFSFGMHCMLNGINYLFIKYAGGISK